MGWGGGVGVGRLSYSSCYHPIGQRVPLENLWDSERRAEGEVEKEEPEVLQLLKGAFRDPTNL